MIVSARSASPRRDETRTERPAVRLASAKARRRRPKTVGQWRRGASRTATTPIPAAGHQAAVLPVRSPTSRATAPARYAATTRAPTSTRLEAGEDRFTC